MRSGSASKSMLILFSILLAPAVVLGSTPQRRNVRSRTPNSSNWGFSTEAARILNQVKLDSSQVHDMVATLQAYNDESFLIGWRQEGELLQTIRQKVNEMDMLERRLRIIARVTDSGQWAVIKRVVPQIILLSDETNSAILFLNEHRDELWAPKYAAYANEMYQSSGLIDHDLRNPQMYAGAPQSAHKPKT